VRTGVPYRVIVAGAELRMLVLATEPSGSVGVDLDSGAFVRAAHPPAASPPAAFDVVTAEIAGRVEPPDDARPEAVELARAPVRVGRLAVRRAERYLAPLRHPRGLPLLGLGPNAVPYWTLSGDRPSVALVEPHADPRLVRGPDGVECHFEWLGAEHELPVLDPDVVAQVEALRFSRPSRASLERILGYRPKRLLVMLTQPIDGYCHKAVAALLPGARG
jgi:hypothetical protein